MYNNIIGSKYESTKNLSISEIGKLIKKDIQSICKNKVSVKKNDCDVLHIIINEDIETQKIRDIVESYNYDKSDVMSDYFDYRFYFNIQNEFKKY